MRRALTAWLDFLIGVISWGAWLAMAFRIFEGGAFTAAILTSREMHSIRELTLTYYLWGLPFSARVTYNP